MNVSSHGAIHETPLHMACCFGQLTVVQYLVEDCRASLTATDARGWTAWFYACGKHGSVAVMHYLFETCKVDTSVRDICGATAICHAVGELDALRYYLTHCPNVDANEPDCN